MKRKTLLALGLSLLFVSLFPCTANAIALNSSENYIGFTDADYSRYTYVQSTVTYVDPSSSGVEYSVSIFGNSLVTSISGTIKVYKGTTEIYSTYVYSGKRTLFANNTIPTQGPGTYRVTFNGTVYATTGSEPLELEHTDSY